MAGKEIAISKRLKISEAQQYMLISVAVASIFLGVAISLSIHFVKMISFNAVVIGEKNKAIQAYSDVIEKVGVCRAPKGNTYTEDELKACNPDSIPISAIPNTLRANILNNLAASPELNAVPKDDDSNCINPETNKNYTYAELNKRYNEASGDAAMAEASDLIKTCSALRVIPDALPAFKNEEALLASLNKIFIISDWEPESLAPSGNNGESEEETALKSIALSLLVEADTETTMNVLHNIERSIRTFDVNTATIEWGGENSLSLKAQMSAYYVDASGVTEHDVEVLPDLTVEEEQ